MHTQRAHGGILPPNPILLMKTIFNSDTLLFYIPGRIYLMNKKQLTIASAVVAGATIVTAPNAYANEVEDTVNSLNEATETVALSVDTQVTDAKVAVDEATAVADETQAAVDTQTQVVETKTNEVANAEQAVADANQAVAGANANVTTADQAVADANQAVTDAEVNLATVEAEKAKLPAKVAEADRAVETANQTVDSAKDAVTTAETDASNADKAASAQETVVADAKDASKDADAKVSTAKSVEKQAQTASDTANKSVKDAEAKANTETATVSQAEKDVNTAEQAVSTAKASEAKATKDVTDKEAEVAAKTAELEQNVRDASKPKLVTTEVKTNKPSEFSESLQPKANMTPTVYAGEKTVTIELTDAQKAEFKETGAFTYVPNNEEINRHAIEYINQIRKANGIDVMSGYDPVMLRDALARATEMYENDRYSHYTDLKDISYTSENINISSSTAYNTNERGHYSIQSDQEFAYRMIMMWYTDYNNIYNKPGASNQMRFGHRNNILFGGDAGVAVVVSSEKEYVPYSNNFVLQNTYMSMNSRNSSNDNIRKMRQYEETVTYADNEKGETTQYLNGKPVVFIEDITFKYVFTEIVVETPVEAQNALDAYKTSSATELATLRTNATTASNAVKSADAKLTTARQTLANAKANATAAQAVVEEAQRVADEKAADLAKAKDAVKSLEAKAETAKDVVVAEEAKLAELKADANSKAKAVTVAKDALKVAETKLADAKSHRASLNDIDGKLAAAEAKVVEAKEALANAEVTRANAETKVADATAKADEATKVFEVKTAELEAEIAKLKALEADNKDAQDAKARVVAKYAELLEAQKQAQLAKKYEDIVNSGKNPVPIVKDGKIVDYKAEEDVITPIVPEEDGKTDKSDAVNNDTNTSAGKVVVTPKYDGDFKSVVPATTDALPATGDKPETLVGALGAAMLAVVAYGAVKLRRKEN